MRLREGRNISRDWLPRKRIVDPENQGRLHQRDAGCVFGIYFSSLLVNFFPFRLIDCIAPFFKELIQIRVAVVALELATVQDADTKPGRDPYHSSRGS